MPEFLSAVVNARHFDRGDQGQALSCQRLKYANGYKTGVLGITQVIMSLLPVSYPNKK
jgi:hypothetical protein